MKILFVADGRSPIAVNWIRYFTRKGQQVHLVSLYPGEPSLSLSSYHYLPVTFSGAARGAYPDVLPERSFPPSGKKLLNRLATPRVRALLRHWFVPPSLPRAAKRLRAILAEIQPDLVHAMRIPFEGMVTALAEPAAPFILSIWGNDFTLHARSNPVMARYTRLALQYAGALIPDCQRDRRLATEWGFSDDKPALVLPGGGGVQLDVFYPPPSRLEPDEDSETGQGPEAGVQFTVINPRGIRTYIRNHVFFQSIPTILREYPQTQFLFPGMASVRQAERWTAHLDIAGAVTLLPQQARPAMADLFRCAQVAVSPSVHDGTPNTLLEAMACGCFPIAGDIESLREWIEPGENGLLVDPNDANALAQAVITALADPTLRTQAAVRNFTLVKEKAEYHQVMARAESFYREVS